MGNAQRWPQGRWLGLGSHAQGLLFVLAQVVHVRTAVRLEPVLVPRDRERSDQPQTTRASAKRRPKIKPSGMERATAPRGARPKRQAKGDAKTAQRVVAE